MDRSFHCQQEFRVLSQKSSQSVSQTREPQRGLRFDPPLLAPSSSLLLFSCTIRLHPTPQRAFFPHDLVNVLLAAKNDQKMNIFCLKIDLTILHCRGEASGMERAARRSELHACVCMCMHVHACAVVCVVFYKTNKA